MNAELDCAPVQKLVFEPTQMGIESKMSSFICEELVFNNICKIMDVYLYVEAALPIRRANKCGVNFKLTKGAFQEI